MVSRLWFIGCINNYYCILHGSYVAVWVMGSPTILLLQVTKCQMWHRCYLNKEQHVTKSHNHLSKNNDFPVVTNCTTQRICPKGQHLVEAAKIWQMIAIFFFSIPHPTQLDHYSNVTKDDVSNPAAAVGVGLMLPGFYTLLLCGEERPTTSLRRDWTRSRGSFFISLSSAAAH